MKYNKSEIMRRAWGLKKGMHITMSEALRMSWAAAKNGQRSIVVKSWVVDKAQRDAYCYGMNISTYAKTATTTEIYALEQLAETEKAIKVRVATGDVIGSGKGWLLWIPKSQIVA